MPAAMGRGRTSPRLGEPTASGRVALAHNAASALLSVKWATVSFFSKCDGSFVFRTLTAFLLGFLLGFCPFFCGEGALGCTACEVLVSQPGIKLQSPALEGWHLSHWTARGTPRPLILMVSALFSEELQPIGTGLDTPTRWDLGFHRDRAPRPGADGWGRGPAFRVWVENNQV